MSKTRSWLITTTTYGTWLPGDERGFVGRVTDYRTDDIHRTHRVEHDRRGTEYDRDIPKLRAASGSLMKGPPIWLNAEQAEVILNQFLETATHRRWEIHAITVMSNHIHIVVTAPDEYGGDDLLRDFKSYASRALNGRWPRPASGTWWTKSGSKPPLESERALEDAIVYVLNQHEPLAVYPAL